MKILLGRTCLSFCLIEASNNPREASLNHKTRQEEEKPKTELQNGEAGKEKEEEVNTEETGTKDEPEPSNRLEDPEVEDIKTVTAGDTMYSSAKKFEDLPISEPLLQVISDILELLHQCLKVSKQEKRLLWLSFDVVVFRNLTIAFATAGVPLLHKIIPSIL